LADPQKLGFAVRYPIVAGKFNTRDYPSNQLILDDIETIIIATLREKLGIEQNSLKVFLFNFNPEVTRLSQSRFRIIRWSW